MTALRRATVAIHRTVGIASPSPAPSRPRITPRTQQKVLEGLRTCSPTTQTRTWSWRALKPARATSRQLAAILSTLSALWMPAQSEPGRSTRRACQIPARQRRAQSRACRTARPSPSASPRMPPRRRRLEECFSRPAIREQAMDHFLAPCAPDSGNQDALSGSGEATLRWAIIASARRYLALAPRGNRVVRLNGFWTSCSPANPSGARLEPRSIESSGW